MDTKIYNPSAFRVDWCSSDMLTVEGKLLFVYATDVTSFHEVNTDSVLSALFEYCEVIHKTGAEKTKLC